MRYGLQITIAAALAMSIACGSVKEAPPLPEVLVVVDTNLPVPLVAGRLRVDLYAENGAWFDTSDFGRPDKRDWPASFSVYSDDQSRERLVWVRLRAYPEGAVDTYAGERFRDVDNPFAVVVGDEQPRLAREGIDVTPSTEPSPLLTVDRLVAVRLRPETRGRVRVLLHGACVGTMVQMSAGGTPVLGEAQSCIATEKTREAVAVSPIEEGELATPTTTEAGTWLTGNCPPAKPEDTKVCISGGATILGSRENSDYAVGSTTQLDPAPPRVFGLSPFFVDRDELTVGELTALVDSGYSGPLPQAYDGELAQPTVTNKLVGCTWSFKTKGRDAYSVTCAGFRAARGICQYRGGDLLTEAQWEHVATVGTGRSKQRYPWGLERPTCERAIWGRIALEKPNPDCNLGAGPRLPSEAQNDVSLLGVRSIYGGVVEWVLDDAAPYDSRAWANVSVVDPHAELGGAKRIIRGSSWMGSDARPIFRYTTDEEGSPPVGIRCAYPVKK